MPEPGPAGDLVAAVSDALRSGRTKLRDMVAGAHQRTQERAIDTLLPRTPDQNAVGSVPAPAPRPIPQPGRDRDVDIRLRNGRRVRATIAPALARRRDLSAIARVSADNDRRAFDALRRHRLAIERLTRLHEELAKKVSALQSQGDEALIGLVQGFAGLERQVRDVTTQASGVIATTPSSVAPASRPPDGVRPVGQPQRPQQLQRLQQLRQIQEGKVLATRAQIQNVTNVVNTVQAAAFGEKGTLLATNNLLLAGNQLFWSLLDPVLQRVGVLNATSATVMAAIAPLGTLLTGQILLGDRQRVRFISGIATFDGTNTVVRESLRDQVGERFWPEFQRRTDVPVTTTVLSSEPDLFLSPFRADVVGGTVRITLLDVFEGPLPSARVGWMVDTGADVG